MSFSLSSLFGTRATTTTTTTAPAGPTYAVAGPSGYQQDAFTSTARFMTASASSTPDVKLPLAAIVDGPNAFGCLFIKSSEGLLKVGGDGGSFGRFFLNLFAGAV